MLKEKEPKCDFCFLREKEVIKCMVTTPLYRIALFAHTQLALPALPKIQRLLISYAMAVSTKYLLMRNAFFALFKMDIFFNWQMMEPCAITVRY